MTTLQKDSVQGTLEVGCDRRGDVVVQNIPPDTGHIVFSMRQAIRLAVLLMRHAKKNCDCMAGIDEKKN